MQSILLGLSGKQIAMAKVVQDQDENFDWVKESYPDSDTRSYILIPYDEDQYKLAASPYSYYDAKAKKVKAMTTVKASVDKSTIENDGVDSVTLTITTSEPMSIIVNQQIGQSVENGIFSFTPDGGKIIAVINSDCIGLIRLNAIGDTKYIETIEVAVV